LQTFLPFSDFGQIARCLDRRRLSNQRLEAFMIFEIIKGLRSSCNYSVHPCTLMWKDYPDALSVYIKAICDETARRSGGIESVLFKLAAIVGQQIYLLDFGKDIKMPWWLGNEKLHYSHRSRLKQKDPIYYASLDGDLETDYWWPDAYERTSNCA
jgi:hypothetical protein